MHTQFFNSTDGIDEVFIGCYNIPVCSLWYLSSLKMNSLFFSHWGSDRTRWLNSIQVVRAANTNQRCGRVHKSLPLLRFAEEALLHWIPRGPKVVKWSDMCSYIEVRANKLIDASVRVKLIWMISIKRVLQPFMLRYVETYRCFSHCPNAASPSLIRNWQLGWNSKHLWQYNETWIRLYSANLRFYPTFLTVSYIIFNTLPS